MISFLRVAFECSNIILPKKSYSLSKLCKEFSSASTLPEHDAEVTELNAVIPLPELQNRLPDGPELDTTEGIKAVIFVDQCIKSLTT